VIILEKNCKRFFLEQGHRLHGPTINSIFWLQSDPTCKPHAHVKLEAGPGLFGAHKILSVIYFFCIQGIDCGCNAATLLYFLCMQGI
jgi:hypothetical protein